jgi:PPOX class probable F420-dependent enzyme
MTIVPESMTDLLERPTFAHLATIRPDGKPQVNPMWFVWDGSVIRFTHTDERQKFKNLALNPAVAISICDPDNPYRYLEVRGKVTKVTPDPSGAFHVELARRYGHEMAEPPADALHRIILEVTIEHAGGR